MGACRDVTQDSAQVSILPRAETPLVDSLYRAASLYFCIRRVLRSQLRLLLLVNTQFHVDSLGLGLPFETVEHWTRVAQSIVKSRLLWKARRFPPT